MWKFLDIFFIIFHTLLILFNLSGWAFKKIRKYHLWSMGTIIFSWGIMGFWYGFGYCFCTDWHWQVRQKLGLYDMPNSYTKFLFDELTGLDSNPELVDTLTLISFIAVLVLSVFFYWRDRSLRKKTEV